jgi:hypothetical protein
VVPEIVQIGKVFRSCEKTVVVRERESRVRALGKRGPWHNREGHEFHSCHNGCGMPGGFQPLGESRQEKHVFRNLVPLFVENVPRFLLMAHR